ncbi:ATPase, T2SS/T4P/T4SS family [Janthinobacterium lividum]|uniref:ATPase, T2SS/T4P/T4SS family n=1 Tax=Janthinobacterium TaxID=29580 RepID=UPI00088738DE|nr:MULTISPECIES: ATPase, T2SS/T4P/T4SS family [Janthinobacterium]MCC7712259.1 Flp pilus assembly complex ATPase component TadA [Janthinobacterium lividum]OEZ54925.1 type II secretion system protein E [Janthinobacterium lividum]WQE27065.1 ATPase, T2SS/T4P/T4SS family [Janthinobacterium lividum]SDG80501.1 Type II secretory pathway ATPase GspE/PulE or T4P pilus assembly pathway ATPase PilB [Janthinobacterium sp. YR213]STQ97955.1 Type II traffic warden ATPase [Janthinobacterium lividum]
MLTLFRGNNHPEHPIGPGTMVTVRPAGQRLEHASGGADSAGQLHTGRTLKVEHLDQLGDGKILLVSGGDQLGQYKIPKGQEYAVAAITQSKGRATIIVDPEYAGNLSATLTNLRTKLVSHGYHVESGQIPCSPAVIKSLVDDYQHRISQFGGEEASSSSEWKTLFESIGDIAVRAGASDIHCVCENERGTVQIRIDGELEPLPGKDKGIFTATQLRGAVSWAYTNNVQTGSNTESQFQDDVNASAMIKSRVIDGKKIAMRYQSFRSPTGPKIVCRLLNTDSDAPSRTFEELGYASEHIDLFQEVPYGPPKINILAGITGSGKTTTAQSFWESHPGNGRQAFFSIEDPIELRLKGVHQISFQRNLQDRAGSEREFNGIVMDLLRGDLDAAFIGEIRDRSSGAAAQEIVFTGHMAMGTLHAQFISGIVPRLTDQSIGLNRSVLTAPNVLGLLSYQALVPLLCPTCKIAIQDVGETRFAHGIAGTRYGADMELHRIHHDMAIFETRFDLPRDNFFLRRDGGCNCCRGRGIKGQTVVAEMMIPDERWLQLTREGRDIEAYWHFRSDSDKRFDTSDMRGKTVFEHTLFKAICGLTDPRNVAPFGSFARFAIPGK